MNPDERDELRALIREAHEAIKDLRTAIRDAKATTRDMADAAAKAAFEASNDEMARWSRHIQAEMNRSARDLNRAVEAARDHIGRSLMPKIASLDTSGAAPVLLIEFEGGKFDADWPLPAAPAREAGTS